MGQKGLTFIAVVPWVHAMAARYFKDGVGSSRPKPIPLAWFKNGLFRVTQAQRIRPLKMGREQACLEKLKSQAGTGERRNRSKPSSSSQCWMLLPGHEFRRAFAHAHGVLASCEGAVIQEKA